MSDTLTRGDILKLCEKWQNELKINLRRVQIRKMKNKWGSCSTRGILTLNKEVMKLPLKYAEYVIVHELLHLIIPNHSRTFKTLLYVYFPEWEEIHENLQNAGYRK
jgi:hypothetical protein